MVTCRAVGIGSYLVRLGQRVIQTEPSYVILTGYQALNKVKLKIKNISILITNVIRKLQIAGVGQRGVQLAQPAGWSPGDAQ